MCLYTLEEGTAPTTLPRKQGRVIGINVILFAMQYKVSLPLQSEGSFFPVPCVRVNCGQCVQVEASVAYVNVGHSLQGGRLLSEVIP